MRTSNGSKKAIAKIPGFPRVLKQVATAPLRLPRVVASSSLSVIRTPRTQPQPGEEPAIILRVRIFGCKNLAARDKNGASDPFVVVALAKTRFRTPHVKGSLNPHYSAKDATFDFSVYASLADVSSVLEVVVWDKDLLGKEYLGEAALSIEEWFKNGPLDFTDPENAPISVNLMSTRTKSKVTGSVQIQIGLVKPTNAPSNQSVQEIFFDLVRKSLEATPSIMSAPPTRGIGTVRSRVGREFTPQDGEITEPELEDDGLNSEDEEDAFDEDEFFEAADRSGEESPPRIIPPTKSENTWLASEPPSLQTIAASPINDEPVQPIALAPDSLSPPPIPAPAPGPVSSVPASAGPSFPTAGIPVQTPSGSSPSSKPGRKFFPVRQSSKGPNVEKTPKESKLRLPGAWPSSGSESASATPTPYMTPGGEAADYVSAGGQVLPIKDSVSKHNLPVTTPGGTRIRRPRFKKRVTSGYNLDISEDIQGIVMLEIAKAEDLPKIRNITRTGWDMDPFVVVSFSKKVFRTRVIRHTLNPHWEEKLLFHVRKFEENFEVKLAVLDWDKLTGNDLIGEIHLPLRELMTEAPQPDPKTGLYPEGGESAEEMKTFVLPLVNHGIKELAWQAKYSPKLTFRARYQPYDALRQRFWRQYLRQYDLDETGTFSLLELRSMLDSLGSTLTKQTVEAFFTRYNKSAESDELTIEQCIVCLEQALTKPASERSLVPNDAAPTGMITPGMNLSDFPSVDGVASQLELTGLDAPGAPFGSDPAISSLIANPEGLPEAYRESAQTVLPGQGPPTLASNAGSSSTPVSGPSSAGSSKAATRASTIDVGNYSASLPSSSGIQSDVSDSEQATSPDTPSDSAGLRSNSTATSTATSLGGGVLEVEGTPPHLKTSSTTVERVINIKTCPLCHLPRLNNKAELDMVTHLAVCASSDWNRVNRIVVGNYVTASQAQRKWYTNVIAKVSSGAYQLGANSANIIVQNRLTGQLEEEKMQAFVRLGIRLLYKGATSRMEGGKARRLLKSMSIKQGLKYDSTESAREIPSFIAFHNLKVEEILEPIDSFKTFNKFFYRKLKESARPVTQPQDPTVLVSGADCRMMAFQTVTEATKLWIKGREFTTQRLLAPVYANDAPKYVNGSLAIFRLAPQDYHRFHSPVDGTIGPMTYIPGEYYTVNPQAVRSPLDIYGENARKIVPIDSPHFGRVYACCIGAMMVGSIITTVNEGDHVARGQEFGYFAFGGSTIVLLFEKGVVQFDEDLVINGQACLETLVRVGMQIGRSVRSPAVKSMSIQP